jgi:hypothetical protein
VVSIGVYRVELELENGDLVPDFKDDLTVTEHCELERALGVCGAYLLENV